MYHLSRSIYRELAALIDFDRERERDAQVRRVALLAACEETVRRLVHDRYYFARPARTLFADVRMHFPLSRQLEAYRVIERHIRLVEDCVDQSLAEGRPLGGEPPTCAALNRSGRKCQREPIAGMRYCPSHKHLEARAEVAA